MRRALPWLRQAAALVAAVVAVHAGEAAQASPWTANEDDALLLELHSGKYKLGEPMRGYQTPGGVCVDFADLIQALDLPVRLDKKSRRATGWLFAEDQRLIIDRDANTVQNVNGERTLTADAIQDTPEGWCVDTGALSAWFGVRFKPDLGNLAIALESDRKLPFLEAIERRSRAARLLRSIASRNGNLAPRSSAISTSPECRRRSCLIATGARLRSTSSSRQTGRAAAVRSCSTRRSPAAKRWG